MYTPAQVSAMLGIPLSTLRRYSVLFAAHLTPQAKHRKRSYTEQDIATLARARDLSAQGVPLHDITAQLALVPAAPPEEPKQDTLALVPTIAAELETTRELARSALAALQTMQEQLSQVQTEHEQLTARLDKLEHYVTQPWYRRILKPPK